MNKIDLRSDTVTRPSDEMKAFMISVPLGDDVLGDDPTVSKLEDYCKNLFNVEEAIFCPSGTMSNQIGLAVQLGTLEEVITERDSHIYQYEVGGLAFNSRANISLIAGKNGKISGEQIKNCIRKPDLHKMNQKIVSLENTTNRGGGAYYAESELKEISKTCLSYNLSLHLDGARLFNAITETKIPPRFFGEIFDSVSICLSKGLGAPVGSLILFRNGQLGFKARQLRKVLGGGMRQSGMLAAAGLFALKNNIADLKNDHQLALNIKNELKNWRWVKEVKGNTNIIIIELDSDLISGNDFVDQLKNNSIDCFEIAPNTIRFVTHRDLPLDTLTRLRHSFSSLTQKSLR